MPTRTAKIYQNQDVDGNLVYPQTVTDAVIDPATGHTIKQDLEGKVDKASSPTQGNFVSFGPNGTIIDSGKKSSDFEPANSNILKRSDIVDNLTTQDNTKVLSASKGKELKTLIDAIEANQDVKAIFATAASMSGTGLLTNDVVKVLADEDHSDVITYYKWNGSSFDYIGSLGQYYTKTEADGKFATTLELNQLSQEVYGQGEITWQEITPNTGYWNTKNRSVGDLYNPDVNSLSGYRKWKVAVNAGETYRIYAYCSSAAVRDYVVVDANDIITKIAEDSTDHMVTPVEINIDASGWLYANHIYTDHQTGFKLEKKVVTYSGGIPEDIANSAADTLANAKAYCDKETSTIIGKSKIIYDGILTSTTSNWRPTIPMNGESGIIRVSIRVVEGTPNATVWRLYGVENDATSATSEISNHIPLIVSGSYVDTIFDVRYDSLQIFTGNTTICRFHVRIEKLDTDYAKLVNGENILIFGDSQTEFHGPSSGLSGHEYLRWTDIIQVFKPGVNVTNVAIGGSRISQLYTPSLTPSSSGVAYSALCVYEMAKAISDPDYDWGYQDAAAEYLDAKFDIIATAKLVDISKIDTVVIMGGLNDYFQGVSLGDEVSSDKSTIMGAFNKIIEMLLTANPKLKIYIASQCPVYMSTLAEGETPQEEYMSDNYNTGTLTYIQMANGIESVAKKNHIPFIDVFNELGWNRWNFKNFFNYTVDVHHPYFGFRDIAKIVANNIWRA